MSGDTRVQHNAKTLKLVARDAKGVVARLRGMEYAEAMGPKGKVLDAMPSDEVLDLFWETLAGADAETLSFQSMRARARPLPLLTATVTSARFPTANPDQERLQDMSLDENRDGET